MKQMYIKLKKQHSCSVLYLLPTIFKYHATYTNKCRMTVETPRSPNGIEWRSQAPSGRAYGTDEIEKYEWVSMERR